MLVPTQVTTQAMLPAAATWGECLCRIGHGAPARGGTTAAQTRQRSPDRPAGSGADRFDPLWAGDRESDQHQADDDPDEQPRVPEHDEKHERQPGRDDCDPRPDSGQPRHTPQRQRHAPNAATTAAIRTVSYTHLT